MTLRIRSLHDLESLSKWRRRGARPDRLLVEINNVSEPEARTWEVQLSRYYFACGCVAASLVLLLALCGYLVVIALSPGGFAAATWRHGALGALVGFAAAGSGKVLGLLYARWRLHTTIRSLAARIVDSDAGPETMPPGTPLEA